MEKSIAYLADAEEYFLAGAYDKAEAVCQAVLVKEPACVEAWFLLGNVHASRKSWVEAVACFREAVGLHPASAVLLNNLGLVLTEAGMFDEALVALDKALVADPDYPTALYNKGVLCQRQKRYEAAAVCYEQALSLLPTHAGAWKNLGAVRLELGDTKGALSAFRSGQKLAPEDPDLLMNISSCHMNLLEYEAALDCMNDLLRLGGGDKADIHARMANLLCYVGRVDQGIEQFEAAIALAENERQRMVIASCRLFILHYSAQQSPEQIAREHRSWGERFFPETNRRFVNPPVPGRRLRVGYVSPDFRTHAVVFFIQPVLAAHDTGAFEVFCYANVDKPDEVTRQLREGHPVVWRDISALDDVEAAAMIRADGIDILVDLAGHSANNRLPLFGAKPAPVQVSWIGYPDTTGLTAMDYRITDGKADPPGMTEQLHTEELIRLPRTFLCYRPGGDFPVESPLPRLANGHVTFGTFSNFTKVTPGMIATWAKVLNAVPCSRFVTRVRGVSQELIQRSVLDLFACHGVAGERIEVLGFANSVVNHLQDYHRIDIALDTFPYCGTTTTCESLYMGVPVISLAGRAHVSRVGVSLLETVGISDLIAETEGRYVEAAVALANDLPRLLQLRKSLRQMLLGSPLADNVAFVKALEAEYRRVWRVWCDSRR